MWENSKNYLTSTGDELLGLKLRTSKNIVGELGLEPLKAAVKIGEKINRPLMVHITNPPAEMEKVLEILRPGDIVTHMYQNVGYTILKMVMLLTAYGKRENEALFLKQRMQERTSHLRFLKSNR